MLRLDVNVEDAAAMAMVRRAEAAGQDGEGLHLAMAMGVEALVKKHLRAKYVSRSPNTGFYGRMAEATAGTATKAEGTVTVGAGIRGAALRYFGGTVAAGKTISSITGRPTRLLAIPTKDVPVSGSTRETPANMGMLKYLPSTKGGGVLVEGEQVTGKRGKTRVERKPGGRLLFILKAYTKHDPDPGLLPDQAALEAAARAAAGDHIAAATASGSEGARRRGIRAAVRGPLDHRREGRASPRAGPIRAAGPHDDPGADRGGEGEMAGGGAALPRAQPDADAFLHRL